MCDSTKYRKTGSFTYRVFLTSARPPSTRGRRRFWTRASITERSGNPATRTARNRGYDSAFLKSSSIVENRIGARRQIGLRRGVRHPLIRDIDASGKSLNVMNRCITSMQSVCKENARSRFRKHQSYRLSERSTESARIPSLMRKP